MSSTTDDTGDAAQNDDQHSGADMTAILDYGESLDSVIKAAATVNEESVFEFADDGLTVSAWHPDTAGAVFAEVPASAFESYDVPKGHEFSLGFDNARLRDVMKAVGGDRLIEWDIDLGRTRQVKVSAGTNRRASVMPLEASSVMGANRDRPPIEGMAETLPVDITIDDMKDALDVVRLVEDSTKAATFHIPAAGSDLDVDDPPLWGLGATGDNDYVFAQFEDAESEPDHNSANGRGFSTKYGIEFLAALVGTIPSANDVVSGYVGNDAPLMFKWETDSGATVDYLLAPRIDD